MTTPRTLVLWRGAPKWYLSSPQSSSGGGSAESFQFQQSYGDVELSLKVFSRPTKMVLNGIDVADTSANVFMVDGVDRGSIAPTIKGLNVALASGTPLEAALAAADNADVLKFLQCPSATSPAWLVCSRLGGG